MIVDDVPIYREYLRNSIDWAAYGFTVCCEAKDGKEALEFYDKYEPDILLTDIMMPFMNGIELSEAILRENPEASIVLITGNSEFEYARKAVKLGVCDYIVKPFEKEELLITLLKLQDNINRVLEMQSQQDELKKDYEEQILRQYIYSNRKNNRRLLKEDNIFKYPFFIVATLRIDLYENKIEQGEIVKWKEVISSMLFDMVQIKGSRKVFHDFEGNVVIIINFEDKQSMEEYEGFEFQDIVSLANDHIGFNISIGISDYCYGTENLKDAYYETIQALSNSYVEQRTRIFEYKRIVHERKSSFYSWDLIEEINKYLEILDYKSIEDSILQELDQIKEYENTESATMIYMSLLSVLFSYLTKHGRNMDDIFGKGFHPYSVINSENTYIYKREFLCKCYRDAIDYQLSHQDTKSHQIARQAKEYIERNYANNDLSIADISKELLVNQTYLRRMFKEEYNMTISDYITKYRMETAKELILNNNYKLSYVSDKVGYNDSSYFSKCFKKYFGYLPSDINN